MSGYDVTPGELFDALKREQQCAERAEAALVAVEANYGVVCEQVLSLTERAERAEQQATYYKEARRELLDKLERVEAERDEAVRNWNYWVAASSRETTAAETAERERDKAEATLARVRECLDMEICSGCRPDLSRALEGEDK